MEWVPANWAMIVALIAGAVAWGRHSQRLAAIESRQAQVTAEIRSIEARHTKAQAELATALESIRISLARMEEAISALRRA